MRALSLFALAAVVGPGTAHASDGLVAENVVAGFTPAVLDISALVWTHFGVDFSNPDAVANEFDVDRVYLTARRDLGEDFSARMTLDVGRSDSDLRLQAYLKYAYIGWTPVDSVEVRMGAAGTPYVGFAEKFWGHRFVSKAFVDQVGIQGSSDFGLHALGEHANGRIAWAAALLNGGGYKVAETDAAKTAQLRVTVDPLDGEVSLPITVYGSTELGAPDGGASFAVFSVGLAADPIVVFAEYLMVSEGSDVGQGVAGTVVPRIGEVVSFPVRVDWFDGPTDDTEVRVVAAVSREVYDAVSVAVAYEREAYVDEPVGVEQAVFLRVEAGF